VDTNAFLDHLTSQNSYDGQIVHIERIPPHAPRYGELDKPLAADLHGCLSEHDLLPLYTHQAKAVNRARCGENVVIATSSASGKTLCYNIPVIEKLLVDNDSRALYLYPTKALAQDQLRGLREQFCPELFETEDFATYDGDTPQYERADIRKQARIILSNPDMLHIGILPNHSQWSRFLRHLEYVVIDEAHIYRGVFGSHLANVIRRLHSLCDIYGSKPQFICSSATIANPGELAEGMAVRILFSGTRPSSMLPGVPAAVPTPKR